MKCNYFQCCIKGSKHLLILNPNIAIVILKTEYGNQINSKIQKTIVSCLFVF